MIWSQVDSTHLARPQTLRDVFVHSCPSFLSTIGQGSEGTHARDKVKTSPVFGVSRRTCSKWYWWDISAWLGLHNTSCGCSLSVFPDAQINEEAQWANFVGRSKSWVNIKHARFVIHYNEHMFSTWVFLTLPPTHILQWLQNTPQITYWSMHIARAIAADSWKSKFRQVDWQSSKRDAENPILVDHVQRLLFAHVFTMSKAGEGRLKQL